MIFAEATMDIVYDYGSCTDYVFSSIVKASLDWIRVVL